MVFLATIDPSPRLQPIKFPVFSQLAGNLASETGSLETASSSGEFANCWSSRHSFVLFLRS